MQKRAKAIIATSALLLSAAGIAIGLASTANAYDASYYVVKEGYTIEANGGSGSSNGGAWAYCNTGDTATGGGGYLNNGGPTSAVATYPLVIGEDTAATGWYAEFWNATNYDRTGWVFVICKTTE